jgi:MFS superfamily sulfate permease-like transporter
VALLGVLPGILIAVALSILNVFRRVWWPHQAELGRVEGIDGLHDTASHPDAELLPGLVVYRFDAPLIFANSRIFGDEIRAIAENRRGLKWIVIAAEPITDVDTTASDMLQELDVWLNERGISLIFAELKDPVREKIERYELTRTIDPDHFFPTIDTAVERYMHETEATWKVPKDEVSPEPGSAVEQARTIHDQTSKQDR